MICEECKKEEQKSIITIGVCFTTAMGHQPFYDEESTYHSHDANVSTTEYSCSRGHKWAERMQRSCPSCTWPDKPPPQIAKGDL